jgi:hypothetical protein
MAHAARAHAHKHHGAADKVFKATITERKTPGTGFLGGN